MRKKALLILAMLLILIAAGCAGNITGEAIEKQRLSKEFSVDAFRFGYSPDIITVQKGDDVKIKINNIDTIHGIRIPDLGVKGNDFVEFTANKTGEFVWYCNAYCGEGHMAMKGKVIVK